MIDPKTFRAFLLFLYGTGAYVGEALRLARDAAGPGALVVISGSLYLVGEVKQLLPASGPSEQGAGR